MYNPARILGHKFLGTYTHYRNLRNMELAGLCLLELLDQHRINSEFTERFRRYMGRVVSSERIGGTTVEKLCKQYVEIWYEKLFANRL